MIIATTRDFFSIQGTRDSYNEAKRMYEALNSGENLILVEDDTVHRSTQKNREAMYAFFQKHLNNPGSPEDIRVDIPNEDELQVSTKGQLAYYKDAQSVFTLNRKIAETQKFLLDKSRLDQYAHIKDIPVNAAKYAGINIPASFEQPVFSGRFVKPDYIIEKYLIPGSGDYVLPAIFLTPLTQKKNKTILYLDSEGMEHAVNQDNVVHTFVKEGYPVLVADLPGIGSMGPGYMKGDSYIESVSYNQWFTAVLTGKSFVGLRAEDVIRLVHFIKSNLAGNATISAISSGALCSELLHAAAIETYINEVCLRESFLSYADIVTTRFYKPDYIPFTIAGTLEKYDLPDLMAAISPRDLLVINPRQASGEPANQNKIQKEYAFPDKVYADNSLNNFKVISNQNDIMAINAILSWLRKN